MDCSWSLVWYFNCRQCWCHCQPQRRNEGWVNYSIAVLSFYSLEPYFRKLWTTISCWKDGILFYFCFINIPFCVCAWPQVLPSPDLLERNVLICGPGLQVLPMPLFELKNSILFVHTLNEEEQFWDIYLPYGYSSRHWVLLGVNFVSFSSAVSVYVGTLCGCEVLCGFLRMSGYPTILYWSFESDYNNCIHECMQDSSC